MGGLYGLHRFESSSVEFLQTFAMTEDQKYHLRIHRERNLNDASIFSRRLLELNM